MRILCISDVHGHAEALEQVLEVGRINKCGIVLVAGDLCFPGPEPLRSWMLLMNARANCVQGVSDRALALIRPEQLSPQSPEEEARVERLRACRQELGDVILARLARLPTTFRLDLEDGGELMLVHGSPVDPTSSITHDMTDQEVSAMLGDEPADIVVCGGSHVPFDRLLDTTRLIGLGSVGEPPTEGVAHATILETSAAGVEVRALSVVLRKQVVI